MDSAARRSFATLLREYRLARGLSQEALAERAGVSREAISLLERGRRLSPHHDTVSLLAKSLQLLPDERAPLVAAAAEQRESVAVAAAVGFGPLASLPPRLTSFIGREQEIAELQKLLRSKRLVTLTGPGGIGKTSLALKAAVAAEAQFADGLSLVELAALTDGDLVPHAVAAVLSVRERPGEPILTTLGMALGMTQRLLVLDNCEHLLEPCARAVEALLRACPHLRILVTSREPLRVGAEVIWRVPSLTLPEQGTQPLAELAKGEAVRLFVERAEGVRPGFALTTVNAAAVGEICRRLDGIPLAIELAAARVGVLTPEQVARHLGDRFRLLTAGSRTALPRHQTLRALIDWSYDLLTASERTFFQRLAVFVGGFTLEAATVVCGDEGVGSRVLDSGGGTSTDAQDRRPSALGDALDLLIGLVDKSLVQVEERDGEARYRLLETLREYAQGRLTESGQADALQEAHAVFFLTLAEQRTATDWEGRDRRYLDQLELEHDNLRAALQRFADRGDAERGLRLGSALGIFWFIRGYLTEGQRWLERPLGRSDGVSPVARATALEMAGRLAFARGDLEFAVTLARESVAILRRLRNRRRLADVLLMLGMIARDQCRYPEALAALKESLRIHQECDDQYWIAQDLFQLGLIARQQSELPRARSLLDKALTIQSALGEPRSVGATLFNLGLVAEDESDYPRAQSLYEQSVTLMQQVEDRWHLAFLLEALASLSVARGRFRRGALLGGAAATLRRQIGSTIPPSMQPRADRTLKLVKEELGEDAFAQAWAVGQAMTLEQAIAFILHAEAEGA